jgi:protein-tyrosine-phosphatase
MIHSILFVCAANICRSPMAMGLMTKQIARSSDEWRIESAGVWADVGYPAARNTLQVLENRGIDISNHRSRPVTLELIRDFNLILVMERNHKEAMRAAFPQFADRIFILSEMIGPETDIIDPIGGPLVDFEDTAQEIENMLSDGYPRILELVKGI